MSESCERDIVERLRDTPNWLRESYGNWKDCTSSYDRAPFQAADQIEYMRGVLAHFTTMPWWKRIIFAFTGSDF
jgi:hypothetical protein